MNEKFQKHIAKLPLLLEQLKSCKQITGSNLSQVPVQGIYVFIEKDIPIYVGRTNRMKKRLKEHGGQTSGHNKASFAFRLAKEKAKNKGIDIQNCKRKDLQANPEFATIFKNERQRVASMNIKYVEIIDPIEQCLFEVYASMVFGTPYNDFNNH